MTLSNSLVAGANGGFFTIFGSSGAETIDGSGITNGVHLVFIAGSGNDTFIGGASNDSFVMILPLFDAADHVVGGAGFDTLLLAGGGVLAASAFSQVSGIEALNLAQAGNNVTLTNSLVASSDAGFFSVFDGGGNDTVDASGITNGIGIVFFAAGGNDTYLGNAGNSSFVFATGDLTSADTVHAGGGSDTLVLSSGGTLGASAFTNVTGIEALLLNNAGNTVTLTNNLVAAGDFGFFQVLDGTGNDTVDASGVTNATPIVFFSAGGDDTLIGGNGPDSYVFRSFDLTSADHVQAGAGFDTLFFSSGGTVATSAFTNVSGFETLALSNAGNTVTLNDSLVGTSTLGFFQVASLGGNNVVDATGITNGMTIVFYGGPGDDTFRGGTENDTFVFSMSNLTAADLVTGGAGGDVLLITTGGTLTTADISGVSGIEAVSLQAGGTFQLASGLSNTGIRAIGTSAVDHFDGSAVTGYNITFQGGGGADVLIGGAGDDRMEIPDSAFAQIDGNGGLDRIVLASGVTTFDLTANAAKITDIEVIDLTNPTGATLTLAGDDIPLVNASGHSLYVVGDAEDVVNIGDGWTIVSVNATNAAVAANTTFIQYHHTNGSDLFIADTVTTNGAVAENEPPLIQLSGNLQGDDFSISYTTGNAAGARIGDTDASLDDPNTMDGVGVSSHIANLVAHIANPLSGNLEHLDLTATGHTTASANGILISGEGTATITLSGSATDTVYQDLLREIRYVNTDTSPSLNTTARHVTVDTQDGAGAVAAERTATISLTTGNHAPSSAGNSSMTAEDTAYTFKLSDFTFTDPDAGDSLQAVRIDQVPAGAAGALQLNGVAVTAGTTVASSEIAAGHLTFVPALNFNGAGAFTYSVEDHSGTFAASPATMSLTVTAVNDAPAIAAPASVSPNEDVAYSFSGNGHPITISDVDTGPDNVTVTLSVGHGALAATGTGVSGSGTAAATLTGTLSQVNAALATLAYTSAPNFNGGDALIVSVNDQGHTGAGGSLTADRTILLNVAPVNDAPVVDLNTGAGIDRGDIPTYTSGAAAINVAPAVATVTDVEGAISRITLTLTADSGSLDTGTEGLFLPAGAAVFLEFDRLHGHRRRQRHARNHLDNRRRHLAGDLPGHPPHRPLSGHRHQLRLQPAGPHDRGHGNRRRQHAVGAGPRPYRPRRQRDGRYRRGTARPFHGREPRRRHPRRDRQRHDRRRRRQRHDLRRNRFRPRHRGIQRQCRRLHRHAHGADDIYGGRFRGVARRHRHGARRRDPALL